MLTALLIGIIVFALAFWLLGLIGFPAPWNRIAQVVLGLVATGIWTLVHGVTSMRITIPEFPFVGEQALLDHVLDTYARGLAP